MAEGLSLSRANRQRPEIWERSGPRSRPQPVRRITRQRMRGGPLFVMYDALCQMRVGKPSEPVAVLELREDAKKGELLTLSRRDLNYLNFATGQIVREVRRGEATNREAQAPLPASVSATPEGSQRGRSDA